MVSTSGSQLLPEAAIKTLRDELIPLTTLLTPNIPEAQLLLKDAGVQLKEIQTVDGMIEIARSVQALGSQFVLLKGGHLPMSRDRAVSSRAEEQHLIINVLYGHGQAVVLESDYIESRNTHGTGCSLACMQRLFRCCVPVNVFTAAIASNLALGEPMLTAVRSASSYIEAGIKTSRPLGNGHGPINHFHSTYKLAFAP